MMSLANPWGAPTFCPRYSNLHHDLAVPLDGDLVAGLRLLHQFSELKLCLFQTNSHVTPANRLYVTASPHALSSSSIQPRIQRITQCFANEVVGEDGQEDGQAGEGGDPPIEPAALAAGHVQQAGPSLPRQ